MSEPVLACAGLAKTFGLGDIAVPVLRGVDFAVQAGESVAIVGASGSGKSTLLHLLGGLDAPTSGRVQLMGRQLTELDPAAQGQLRNYTQNLPMKESNNHLFLKPKSSSGEMCKKSVISRLQTLRFLVSIKRFQLTPIYSETLIN